MTLRRTLPVAAACAALFGVSFVAGNAILDEEDRPSARPTRHAPPADSGRPAVRVPLALALGRAAGLPGLRTPPPPAKKSPAQAGAPPAQPGAAASPASPTPPAPSPVLETQPVAPPASAPPSSPPATSPPTTSSPPEPDAAPSGPSPTPDPAPSGGAAYEADPN
jgi:hypothetical protein